MADPTQSKTIQYLPAIFQRKPSPDQKKTIGLDQLLLPFEKVFGSYDEVLAVVDRYFAPAMAPADDFLPWLATWIALVLDDEWDEDKRRRLLGEAMELYRWRGTVYGMKRYLQIYTGLEPGAIAIREGLWPAGMQIGVTSRIGFKTKAPAGTNPGEPCSLYHRHPEAHLPPEQRSPQLTRHNDLVDLVASHAREIDATARDYVVVKTLMPTDLPRGSNPDTVPAEGPLQIIYRADAIEGIELEEDGVRLRYRPRAPDEYPEDALAGGTFLIQEMAVPYCFIVEIHGLMPTVDPTTNQPVFGRVLDKVRLILDAEKPAHTRYTLRLMPAAPKPGRRFMQIGVRSSVGLDTTIA